MTPRRRDRSVPAQVWAGIHHKTSPYGGAAGHGYPDETYLARVGGELDDAGVE